eukprot:gene1715-4469_t
MPVNGKQGAFYIFSAVSENSTNSGKLYFDANDPDITKVIEQGPWRSHDPITAWEDAHIEFDKETQTCPDRAWTWM